MSQKMGSYGSWKSPITSDRITSGVLGLGQVELDEGDIYWMEMRPSEAGRYVLVKRSPNGKIRDVNPQPYNARTRVHEYGGGAYKVNQGTIYFTNFIDQRLYKIKLGSDPIPITPEAELRYADLAFDNQRGRMFCVREDHRMKGSEASNTIVNMGLGGEETQIVVSGNDFYSSPRVSPDCNHLAWLTWNHPNMPWDETELWMGKITIDGVIEESEKVAGGQNESVLQPVWSPGGVLHFISDKSNWWNIYRLSYGEVENVFEKDAEFAVPHWVFAMSNYGFESENSLVCSFTEKGTWNVARLDTEKGELEIIKAPYSSISNLKISNGYAVFIGGSPREAPSIVKLNLSSYQYEVLKKSSDIPVDINYLSIPEAIKFPTEKGLIAHALFYKPWNKDYIAPNSELPPLLVFIHGGPTGAASSTLSWMIQFWTSRGFAIVDVNYGGSTGYGRKYRERLNGQWGVVDIDDCVNAAKYLVETGLVDKEKLAIRGGSAGGYTTINALTFRDIFKAGASYYGISDLGVFVGDTHKFESRYLDSLIGPYPEREDLYHNRSAINFLNNIKAPMILFQGLEDKIVPPNQSELIVEALKKKGNPVAYLPFEGEQHGFRQAKNIKRSLEAELYFYSKIFGFELADDIDPVEIENL